MNIEEETRFILNKYKARANKNLGQNFLISEEVVNAIIDSANICDSDLIIEIGPGLGVLTSRMLDKAGKVIAVELDQNMVNILEDRFNNKANLRIINEDILKLDLNNIIKEEKQTNKNIEKVKIVANLPYYISTPIIMKLIESRLDIDEVIVMVQKEVADRLIAKPGAKESGAITYAIDYYCLPSKVIDVDRFSFILAPKVESEVIKLVLRKDTKIKIDNEKEFFLFIKKVFSQRRKTLLNTLVNFKYVEDKEEGIKILEDSGFDQNTRGEILTLEEFGKISKKLF